jgi:ribonucleoside-diphosphate reductase alpha chain
MTNYSDYVHGIKVDYSRDKLFTKSGLTRLKEGYMRDDETSPQQRFAFVAASFGTDLAHAQRLYDYASKMWLSFSTPILSYGKTNKSLPISCYGSFLGDSVRNILDTSSETRMMAVVGGGVGLHVDLRPGDKKSSGIIPHLKTYDMDTLAFKQGTTRRGATAAYLDIDHPEIIEFLEMRKPTGGDPNRKCLNLHHGVNITDDFMQRIEKLSNKDLNLTLEEKEKLDQFPLINKHNGQVVEYVSAKEIWTRILTIRMETGEPYIWFIDAANRALPEYQKALGLKNNGSNLCSEISLATDENRTFVCCLSSTNCEKYDEWKDDHQFIPDIVEMLDNVIEIFSNKASEYPELKRAVYSALRERAIGIGMMGWHAYLQSKLIPFESPMAVSLNKRIWSKMNKEAKEATTELAITRGPCPDSIGSNDIVRNSHLLVSMPTASSSLLMDTSPSIEPYRANVYLEKGVNGTVTHKNKYLEKLLDEKCKNNQETWSDIIANDGSVQQLDFLSDYEKDVFKTAIELDQAWLVQHAADRQEYICQAQSLNLFFHPEASIEYLHLIHLMAWKTGLKGLYYCRSDTIRKADKVGKAIERERIEVMNKLVHQEEEICLACQ